MIAEAAAGLPLLAFVGRREVPDHPALHLLARPNPREGGAAFLEALYGHLLLAGNAYAEQVPGSDGRPAELHGLRPDRMAVVPGPDGWPAAYDYTVGGRTLRFDQEQGGVPPVLHLRLFHPLDDHYGLAPAAAAAAALDIHNAAGFWNKALLDNAARPSGALVYAGPPGVDLTDAQFERLRAELEASFQGAANAGRPLLLEGGLDWKPLSLSPKEMDFVEAKAAAARDIALAFGVPPMLLGLPGDNTYANYAEANRSCWRQTVIPLATRTAQALAGWLGPAWPEAGGSSGARSAFSGADGLRLEPDLDRIEALSTEREALWSRVGAAGFLTDDEKREAVGYGPRPGTKAAPPAGSFTVKPSPQGEGDGDGAGSDGGGGEPWRNQPRVPAGNPDGGQWTDGAGGVVAVLPASQDGDEGIITGAGGTTKMNHAAHMLRLDRVQFSDMLHELKENSLLRPRDKVSVYPNGNVYLQGKLIDNIWNYKK
jgi:HK97 family phage portal protein